MSAYRDLVPAEVTVPCEYAGAVISVPLIIEADPVRVTAPSLGEVKPALAAGAADLVRSQCEMWTRWLARCGQASTR